MTTVYKLCAALIARGRIEGLLDKMDAYLAADRLTPEEYGSLAGMVAGLALPMEENGADA